MLCSHSGACDTSNKIRLADKPHPPTLPLPNPAFYNYACRPPWLRRRFLIRQTSRRALIRLPPMQLHCSPINPSPCPDRLQYSTCTSPQVTSRQRVLLQHLWYFFIPAQSRLWSRTVRVAMSTRAITSLSSRRTCQSARAECQHRNVHGHRQGTQRSRFWSCSCSWRYEHHR